MTEYYRLQGKVLKLENELKASYRNLHDYFAAAALQNPIFFGQGESAESVARICQRIADNMVRFSRMK